MDSSDLTSNDAPEVGAILDFWFGDRPITNQTYAQRRQIWFGKHPDFDRQIQQQFEKTYQDAAAGRLDSWQADPLSCLALILLLDQFPRNIHRGTPLAFATDAKALTIAQDAIAHQLDQQLAPVQRMFIYLPLEHSENLEVQHHSVQLFEQLCHTSPDMADVLEYAIRHRAVIERFGRFPHRNAILGRESTPAEAEFLKQPGSSF